MNHIQSYLKSLDTTLLTIVFFLMVISLGAIYTAQPMLPTRLQHINFAFDQGIRYIIGFVAMFAIMTIEYEQLRKIHWYLYSFGLLLLVGLIPLRDTTLVPNINGAYGWYNVPGFSFQPAEFMKLFLLISMATIVYDHNKRYGSSQQDAWLLMKLVLLAIPPLGLIVTQPDLGTGLVLITMLGAIIIVSGIGWKWLLGLFSAAAVTIGGFMYLFFSHFEVLQSFVPGHALNRFQAWIYPYEYSDDLAFQLIKSLQAIGSGQMFGTGYGQGLVYLPESQTDFIFAVIAEHYGFIGAAIVIIVFFLFLYRMIHIALEASSPFGSYIVTAVIAMFTFQIFQNIGMTIGVLPITGLTLPFISYGGTGIIMNMIAIGLVMNVASKSKTYMFDDD
ncbi:rod shape-determining protein RodA [Exiguobacterium sp. SH3S2]|uniref:FtsW/RodA/SpoVE family cell cycle protein n=1 Tax=Exiguobacterium TaxID=33986 RepID=UPI00087794EB|nr:MULTISPECIES: FtsW/RodA/SpoVE family cell cycle protein [Exiguobacterium]TCI26532.1 rod shape-determining protein RodA [Exiguobacterium sp. SH5S4]TCI49097.1 rod shape-determining protein RodA [Exiguobacterium sp. SH3S3]TCI58111.1 rod shape-determining protein RodA [Exiguobacterium sp. SH5S13]TCI64410.1 rod shape-determining protein RodA [Exiguobacterium sp. SH3S2]TCI66264.1 rod shape-determining protein RodA [Exiguobacterium sp. SH3S1]